MKHRSTVTFIACIVSIMLFVSCASGPQAPAATSTTAKGAVAPTTAPTAQPGATAAKPAASPAAEKPQYGGTITTLTLNGADITNFDAGTKGQSGANYGLVYEQYVGFDWMKGPAGGGPADYFLVGAQSIDDLSMPILSESWKTPSPGVYVLQIRKGMKWQKVDSEAGRLVGGRDVTTDDIIKSFRRLVTAPQGWMTVAQPNEAKAATIEKTGEWEVTIKTPVGLMTSFFWLISGAGFNALYPQEVIDKYGDASDWRNSVGTGPFMLTDYVKGSSLTFTKNPDYWATDPGGPGKGNKLPYVDTYRQLIIPDLSTQLASFRTGKIDALTTVTREDAQPIIKDNPQIVNMQYMIVNTTYGISMRTDKQDLPFKDKRVRQAMMLATDFDALKQTLFGGQAEIDVWPVNKGLRPLYQPITELPKEIQELYKYNPDKAKQLLAEAGYPNGFKTTIQTWNDATLVDELSLFKSQWAKVGIDLTIQPMEIGAYNAMANSRGHDQLIYRQQWTGSPGVLNLGPYRGKNSFNASYINDPEGSHPELETIFKDIDQAAFVDWAKVNASYKKVKPIVIENAYVIPRPQPFLYNMWWPWVKNYYGSQAAFMKYAWVDQNLKKSMASSRFSNSILTVYVLCCWNSLCRLAARHPPDT
jgi:peptide/nickel transport system substrate-binding protein